MKIVKIFAVIATLFLGGCEDKLEIQPKGKVILKTEKEYGAILNNEYMQLYDSSMPWHSSFDSGTFGYLLEGEANLFLKANYLGLDNIDRSLDFASSELYNRSYYRISRYNIIIDNILDAEGDEALKLRTRAEALLLRAYNYFVLVNTFCQHYQQDKAHEQGGIILRTKFSLEEKGRQNSVAEVYQQIEADIAAAIPNLSEQGTNVYRPGLAFAYGLMAKVHLFKQEFDKAELAAKESLKYNSYIFDMVAWDKGTKPLPEIAIDNKENLYFAFGINAADPVGQCIGPSLVKKYGEGDVRKDCFFWFSFSIFLPGCYTYYPMEDYENGNYYSRAMKVNIGGMRVPEVWLMLAECYARKGDIAKAMEIVKSIREKRVSLQSAVELKASTSKEALMHVIDERSRELYLTANNFYDIRRLQVEGIEQQVERVLDDGTIVIKKSSSKTFVMPFAYDAVKMHGGLKQNI